jgi:hypothetical protein
LLGVGEALAVGVGVGVGVGSALGDGVVPGLDDRWLACWLVRPGPEGWPDLLVRVTRLVWLL